MQSFLPKSSHSIISCALLILYMLICWTYKLDTLPGLHGDEAWFGLKAFDFEKNIRSQSLLGMNNYTGILQPALEVLSFKVFGAGVAQLRLSGVILNTLAIVIIGLALIKHKGWKSFLGFIIMIAQSSLFLVSPRIAWEVNTLTLFLFAVTVYCIFSVYRNSPRSKLYVYIFWCVSLLGSYNHILFSSIAVALLATLLISKPQSEERVIYKLIIISVFNVLNLVFLFLTMRYFGELWSTKNLPSILVIIIGTLIIESIITDWIFKNYIRVINIHKDVATAILAVSILCFIYFHGIAFFQVITNYKIFTHVYSWPGNLVMQVAFTLSGATIVLLILYSFYADNRSKGGLNLQAKFLLIYCGVFCLYTTNNSFRYYLIPFAMIALYLCLNIPYQKKMRILYTGSMTVSLCMTTLVLGKVLMGKPATKALVLNVGNHQTETSAHFLPNKPLTDFLRINKINEVIYLSDQYFLEQPILFYKIIAPWQEDENAHAIIDYDYSENPHGGYIMFKK